MQRLLQSILGKSFRQAWKTPPPGTLQKHLPGQHPTELQSPVVTAASCVQGLVFGNEKQAWIQHHWMPTTSFISGSNLKNRGRGNIFPPYSKQKIPHMEKKKPSQNDRQRLAHAHLLTGQQSKSLSVFVTAYCPLYWLQREQSHCHFKPHSAGSPCKSLFS